MKIFRQTYLLAILMTSSLLLFSCSSDDDNSNSDTSVTIEDGRISFDISDFENASMEEDVVYYLNNQYNVKYFQIANNEAIYHNDAIWHIRFEQNSNDEIALPEPGEYPIVQGLAKIGRASCRERV